MTHLPDCDDYAFSGAEYHPNCERICICRQVRRIEQRLLDAAREAVAAVAHGPDCIGHCPCCILGYDCDCALRDALAAIDALRQKP